MPTRLPSLAARRWRAGVLSDFSRGLEWGRFGMFSDKASPDAKNVDWSEEGGFCSRRVATAFHADNLTAEPCWIGQYETQNGQSYVVMSFPDGSIRAITGPDPGGVSQQIKGPGGGCWRGKVSNFKLFLHDGQSATQMWDGTTLAAVPSGVWTPPGGVVPNPVNAGQPIGTFSAAWDGRYWIANTVEQGVRHCNRVRFSYNLFNLKGERDFDENEYIDIDLGAGSECITGMEVCGPNMFVFKEHSVYQIKPQDGAIPYSVEALSNEVGAAGPDSIVCCGGATYFWDSVHGANRITEVPDSYGRFMYVERRFANAISKVMEDMCVPEAQAKNVFSACCMDKVHFSVPWKDGTRRTFVYDARLKVWTCYDLELGPATEFAPTKGKAHCLAVNKSKSCGTRLLSLGQMGDQDDYGDCLHSVQTYVCTPWFTGGDPATKKKFRCLTLFVEGAARLSVEVRTDFAKGTTTELSGVLEEETAKLYRSSPKEIVTLGGTPTEVDCCDADATGAVPLPADCGFVFCPPADPQGCVRLVMPPGKYKAVSLAIRGPVPSQSFCVRGAVTEYDFART